MWYHWRSYFHEILSNFIKHLLKSSSLYTQFINISLVHDRYPSSHILWSRCLLGPRGALSFWSKKAALAGKNILCSSSSMTLFSQVFFQMLSFHLHSCLTHPVSFSFSSANPTDHKTFHFEKSYFIETFSPHHNFLGSTGYVINLKRVWKSWTFFLPITKSGGKIRRENVFSHSIFSPCIRLASIIILEKG